MKLTILLTATAPVLRLVTAHVNVVPHLRMTRLTEPSKYNFPTIIYDNITYKHWQYVRHWTTGDDYGNDDDFTPIYSFNTTNKSDLFLSPSMLSLSPKKAKSNTPLLTSMFSLTMRCNANATFAPETLTVQAGKTLGFQLHAGIDGYLNHPGPLLAYMAKVPIGKTAQNWDGDGKMASDISFINASETCSVDKRRLTGSATVVQNIRRLPHGMVANRDYRRHQLYLSHLA